jgi:hypothetical protein
VAGENEKIQLQIEVTPDPAARSKGSRAGQEYKAGFEAGSAGMATPGIARAASAGRTGTPAIGAVSGAAGAMTTLPSGILVPASYTAAAASVANDMDDLGVSIGEEATAHRFAASTTRNTTMINAQRARNYYSMMTGNPFQVMGELAKRITGAQGFITRIDNAIIAFDEANAAMRGLRRNSKQYADALAVRSAAEAELGAATRSAGSARGVGIGLATFGIQNLLTSVGLFGLFQLITVGAEALGQALDRAINPVKYLREEIGKVADAAESAGGGLARTQQLGLKGDTPLARMLDNMITINNAAKSVDGLLEAIAAGTKDLTSIGLDSIKRINTALGIRGYTQAGTAEETYLLRNAMFESNAQRQTSAGGYNPYLATEEDARRSGLVRQQVELIAKENAQKYAVIGYNDEYLATFQRLIASGMDYAAALNAAADETSRAIYAEIEASGARSRIGGIRSKLLERGMVVPETPVEKAQVAVTDAQKRLTAEQARVNRINEGNARASRISQARAAVGQAGVAGTGDTIFDVALRVLQAKGALSDAQQQTQYQGKIAQYTKEAAAATKALEDEKIGAEIMGLREIIPTLSKDAQAALKKDLNITFTGTDKLSKLWATLVDELYKAGRNDRRGVDGGAFGNP